MGFKTAELQFSRSYAIGPSMLFMLGNEGLAWSKEMMGEGWCWCRCRSVDWLLDAPLAPISQTPTRTTGTEREASAGVGRRQSRDPIHLATAFFVSPDSYPVTLRRYILRHTLALTGAIRSPATSTPPLAQSIG